MLVGLLQVFGGTLEPCHHNNQCFFCILQWYESHQTCPQCGQKFTMIRLQSSGGSWLSNIPRQEAQKDHDIAPLRGYVVFSVSVFFLIVAYVVSCRD